jgi:hypothetical protein
MTELFQELARELVKLPEAEQARWISHFLNELSQKKRESNRDTAAEEGMDWGAQTYSRGSCRSSGATSRISQGQDSR